MTDPVAEHEAYAPQQLGWAVLTVTSSRTLAEDKTGDRIAAMLAAAGQRRVERRLVGDDAAAIASAVGELVDASGVDVVVITGGTGVSPTDVTPEAVTPLLERRLDGFGELFRALSFDQVGAAALLSRAMAGTARGRAIFVLPGSPAAAELGLSKLVLPVAAHLVGQLRRAR
ncbi:MAG TPA: MogA/MoaB family molybdenum cofactor biosynthesis protein [Thermoanaerobaculia bacterium]|nr:MogA/MoaB family molybdenum cofactor biosynthesis protein [Thermoanaerobaculia bacterium]